MFSSLRRLDVWIYLLLVMVPCGYSLAQAPLLMTMTRPWVQLKTTDANGTVNYRIGGVFAEPAKPNRRLSFTFVCHPGGKLTFFVVHMHEVRQTGTLAKIKLQIDGQAPREFEAAREGGQGLASYSVANSTEVAALMQGMAGGEKLRVQIDEYEYDLPLTGFKGELSDLQKVCGP
jgi:hypothetical protein